MLSGGETVRKSGIEKWACSRRSCDLHHRCQRSWLARGLIGKPGQRQPLAQIGERGLGDVEGEGVRRGGYCGVLPVIGTGGRIACLGRRPKRLALGRVSEPRPPAAKPLSAGDRRSRPRSATTGWPPEPRAGHVFGPALLRCEKHRNTQ